MIFSARSSMIRVLYYLSRKRFFNLFELKKIKYRFLIFLILLTGIPAISQVYTGDSLALVTFYNATGGNNWTDHSNWLTEKVSTWYGITVINDRVIGISLNNNNLNGSLPEELDSLEYLEFLLLPGNSLTGSIPKSIGNMDALKTLNLSNNNLSGPLPGEIGGMAKLQDLILTDCSFSGPIPEEIGQILTLRRLDLTGNEFSGEIPNSIYYLGMMNEMKISGQGITGTIPPLIKHLINLQRLTLHDTQLTGELPTEIWNLSTLEDLRLTRSDFYGSIPSDILNLTNLATLHLEENHFSGNIPEEIGELTNLRILDISRNDFEGPIPPSVINLTQLSWFMAGDNFFTDLPDLSSLANITLLDCRNNKLDFGDLDPNLSIPNFIYTPQQPLGMPDTIGVYGGQEFTLTLEIGGTNNIYQWYNESGQIPGANTETIYIAQFSEADEGDYTLQINSSVLTDLTLNHSPIHLVTIKEQTLTLPEINGKTYGDTPFKLEASASSGLPVKYSLIKGNAEVFADSVTISGAGEVIIKVTQEGNEEFLPVIDSIIFNVSKASQMLTFDSIEDQLATVGNIVLQAETDSGLEPVFELIAGDASITGNQLDIYGGGQITIEAFQPGNENYLASDTISHSFQVSKVLGAIAITDTAFVYDGTAKTITVSTTPEGLTAGILYDGSDQLPIDAGIYDVTVNIDDKIYYGSIFTLLIIEKAPADVQISDLNHQEDGTVKEVSVITDPTNLNVSIFYSGNPEPPTGAGEYEVIALIDEMNYQGGDTATMTIEAITGLDLVEVGEPYLIYPNPIKNGKFYIENRREVSTPMEVFVYDTEGRLVFRKENLSTAFTEIELIAPESGTYFLIIHSFKDDVLKKLIIQ